MSAAAALAGARGGTHKEEDQVLDVPENGRVSKREEGNEV